MIEFPRDLQNTIPTSSVKIVGIGGAGANMLDRVALDGLDGAELLALNTDVRTLSGSVAGERIQLGRNLTKGLGTGGDPELGNQAVLEAEDEIRAALKGRKIVFICVGLGGGTGSGAAPIVARLAREEGAFVVMFATMPFVFEGRRRREQAETGLNELAVLSNALVTFDNSRMGELVLAKQGIHEAFAAADRMISESIKAVIRLVVRPGLINIGLDDLMTALRTTRSRCLFGSGIARGKDRAQKALRNALSSPLLDQGALLEDAETVLVHLCGGEDLTLFEIELLMESLGKHVPAKAHVLFGAAVDPGMTDQLSITLVSSLPEERLRQPWSGTKAESKAPASGFKEAMPNPVKEPEVESKSLEPSMGFEQEEQVDAFVEEFEEVVLDDLKDRVVQADFSVDDEDGGEPDDRESEEEASEGKAVVEESEEEVPSAEEEGAEVIEKEEPKAEEESFFAESDSEPESGEQEPAKKAGAKGGKKGAAQDKDDSDDAPFAESGFSFKPAGKELPKYNKSRSANRGVPRKGFEDEPFAEELAEVEPMPEAEEPKPKPPKKAKARKTAKKDAKGDSKDSDSKGSPAKAKESEPQTELSFEGGPRGRFEGADPNVFEGEDLDVPAFLRKKRR